MLKSLKNAERNGIPILGGTVSYDFEPASDFVLLEKLQPGETAAGIHIPETKDAAFNICRVLAVGPGGYAMDGTLIPPRAKVGDLVILTDERGLIRPLPNKQVLVQEGAIMAFAHRRGDA